MPSINGILQGHENVTWEYHSVTLHRVPGYGIGIAVSGGRDNPHFANGDPAIAISDVLKSGPGENKLLVNDRILSANGINLENVDYATAVQVLRDSSVVQLVIKRRILIQNNLTNEFESLQITLNRNGSSSLTSNSASKRYSLEDYGLQITTQLIVTNKYRNLQVGDIITSVNNNSIENKSLKEVKKLIEKSNFNKLELGIQRRKSSTHPSSTPTIQTNSYNSTTNQNLYVQPPRRAPSLYTTNSQNGLENEQHNSLERFNDFIPPPPRPPLPNEDVLQLASVDSSNCTILQNDSNLNYNYLNTTPSYNNNINNNNNIIPRQISFHKKGSVGIRLAGGNIAGIFVTAIQPNSPASLHLQPGDRILSVNNTDLINYTREEAVSLLMSLNNKIDLKVISKLQDYNNIIDNNIGDSFYIRTHFPYNNNGNGNTTTGNNTSSTELNFKIGDIFHVIDTLYNGTIGYWEVLNISNNEKGIIMNKKLAEVHYKNLNKNISNEKSKFFLRRKNKKINSDITQLYQCYERVTYKHPNFKRPIILFGPISDIARERLTRDYYHEFIIPVLGSGIKSTKLSQIREIIENGKHGLLDVNPSCTDKLNYAGLYPIIILLKIDNKLLIKNIRATIKMSSNSTSSGERNRLSEMSKKMTSKNSFESNIKFEKNWSHILTSTLNITNSDTWFKELKELIDLEQKKHIWMSDEINPVLQNDALEQCEINTNNEEYSSYPSNNNRHSVIVSPPSSPNTQGGISIPTEDFSRNTNKIIQTPNNNEIIQTMNEQSILLPNYNQPPPYNTNTTTNNTPLFMDQENEEELIMNQKEKDKEIYNSTGRLTNKINFMPIFIQHSPGMLLENGISKPPKIDRSKKPKSATERLFGGSTTIPTLERNVNVTHAMKSMIYDDESNLEDHEEYYNNNNHHNVYRFTRSTVQPSNNNNNNNNIDNKLLLSNHGNIYQTNSMESRSSGGQNDIFKNGDIINEPNYNCLYNKSDDLSNVGLTYNKIPTSHLPNGQSNYGSNDIYNTKYMGGRNNGEDFNSNGKNIYKDSNDNPYKPIQPIQKMRIGLKPVPPPKPLKPIRTDLYGTTAISSSNSSNSFYLNVPINLGNREQSAFELYRKEQR